MNTTSSVLNTYSRASLNSTERQAGLVGEMCVFQSGSNVIFKNCYASNTFANITALTAGLIIVSANVVVNITFDNVFYVNSSINVPFIANETLSSTNVMGLSPSSLCSKVFSVYDQNSTWYYSRLRIEQDFTNDSFCPPFTSLIPSTTIKTTLTPTSQETSLLPTTSPPSMSFPSTPATIQASLAPTLFQDTSHSPSITPSSFVPSTSAPFLCFYQVANCNLCPQNAALFDLTEGNVSCVFSQQQQDWMWKFTPYNGTITNNAEIVLSGNTTTFVEGSFSNNANLNFSSGSSFFVSGNFTQSTTGQIMFTFNPKQNNNNSSPLNVGGCVSINGNINLNLQTQPQQGTTNFQVISYNCTQQVNISSSQIQVIPNYNGSSCDTINSEASNSPGIIGVSLSSTLGNKCGGRISMALLLGLAIGIPCGVILIVGLSIGASIYNRKKTYAKKMRNLSNEMKAFSR